MEDRGIGRRDGKSANQDGTGKIQRIFSGYIFLAILLLLMPMVADAQKLAVGSKRFTESYVLGEIAKKILEDTGFSVEHKQGLGGTIIAWEALKSGAIQMYPDYTGTIREAILKMTGPATYDEMQSALAEYGIAMSGELGFNNTYALAMPRQTAERLNVNKISDLKSHPALRIGLTHEFLDRKDGWQPLSRHYALQMESVRGLEHALAYAAIKNGEIDLMDAYSTDAKLAEYGLAVMQDDLNFFPIYNAVFLYRLDADPKAIAAIGTLRGSIDETLMIRLNAEAERTKDYVQAAYVYFQEKAKHPDGDVSKQTEIQNQIPQTAEMRTKSVASKIARWTGRHLMLVGISMAVAIVVGVPLGIAASRPGWFSQLILGLTGMIQTIPSLALLALFVSIPMLGISTATAIIALFLYSLLPIVRNTATGLQDISTPLRESAGALGLEPFAQLTKVFLPIASRTILAGVKTSTIINIGTATLAALIGAGGLGEPIISGLALNDSQVILQGAIPAALLAILAQGGFDFLDRFIIPKGLRLETPND